MATTLPCRRLDISPPGLLRDCRKDYSAKTNRRGVIFPAVPKRLMIRGDRTINYFSINDAGKRAGCLRDGDFRAQINVLDGIQQLHTFFHGPLECFAAGDKPGATGTLIDY